LNSIYVNFGSQQSSRVAYRDLDLVSRQQLEEADRTMRTLPAGLRPQYSTNLHKVSNL